MLRTPSAPGPLGQDGFFAALSGVCARHCTSARARVVGDRFPTFGPGSARCALTLSACVRSWQPTALLARERVLAPLHTLACARSRLCHLSLSSPLGIVPTGRAAWTRFDERAGRFGGLRALPAGERYVTDPDVTYVPFARFTR